MNVILSMSKTGFYLSIFVLYSLDKEKLKKDNSKSIFEIK